MRAATLAALVAAALSGGCGVMTREQLDQEAVRHYVQAKLLMEAGDLESALAELVRTIEANPDLAVAHAAMGDIYRKKNDYLMAADAYECAVVANRFSFRNHYNCGFLHQVIADASKSLAEAESHLRRAVVLYLRAVMLKGDDYDATLNLGVCYFRLGEYEQAERHSKKARDLDDRRAHAYTNLGAIYDCQGKYYNAISMYRQSLERDGDQSAVLMNLAGVYVRQKKLKSAIRNYELAGEKSPDSAPPLERLAYCHFFMKQYGKAIEYYDAALIKDPKFADARRGLGVVYMTQYLMDRKNTDLRDRALVEWEASLEIDPNQPNLVKLVEKYAPQYVAPRL